MHFFIIFHYIFFNLTENVAKYSHERGKYHVYTEEKLNILYLLYFYDL
jgi:hypothetical protein